MPNQFCAPQAKARAAKARLAKELAAAETTDTPATQSYDIPEAYVLVDKHEGIDQD